MHHQLVRYFEFVGTQPAIHCLAHWVITPHHIPGIAAPGAPVGILVFGKGQVSGRKRAQGTELLKPPKLDFSHFYGGRKLASGDHEAFFPTQEKVPMGVLPVDLMKIIEV
ncbi:MAG: hypothetical protein LM522_02120, partial [Candidatus Contendobacter sp.]|nr:hypothetical protein [Candidatus Contendobacter sp.]